MKSGLLRRATTNTKRASEIPIDCLSIKRDTKLEVDIQRVWEGNFRVYGVRKVWRQLLREGIGVARWTYHCIGDDLLDRPTDKVNRHCSCPSQSTVGGGYYICSDVDWLCLCGFYHRCFCPVYCWLASESFIANGSGTDALEQALWTRRETSGLIHHSDRGSQYLSIRYTECLAQANIDASVGSIGDSYDNAMAETINGLYKTEVIRHRGLWRSIDRVEFATLEWLDWFNNRRLLDAIGYVPPAEFKKAYYRQQEDSADAA